MTHCERILQHMEDYGTITTAEAFDRYGITRLSGRIFDLRRRGYAISARPETGKNRFGEPVRYTRYMLTEEKSNGKF